MNSLQPAFPQNKRSSVMRAPSDNSLLASCDELYGYVAKGSAVATACGVAVGCVWFLCVAYRAGVLTWPR